MENGRWTSCLNVQWLITFILNFFLPSNRFIFFISQIYIDFTVLKCQILCFSDEYQMGTTHPSTVSKSNFLNRLLDFLIKCSYFSNTNYLDHQLEFCALLEHGHNKSVIYLPLDSDSFESYSWISKRLRAFILHAALTFLAP